MRIKKLAIHGFKSFVDRVTFNLPPGTSAIIGPNGCGKSNIVDAIRWVLGEQNARHLRGKLMEDVIFTGSDSRKPLGMAEVTLTFSNEQGLGPGIFADSTEIEVSRRLYRSGESEYYINRVPSRLRDVVDLFTDTGIGTRAYSIIEQGQVGWLINAKPEERRIIFEEAAGVSRFKHKKEAALRRLEATKENLTRVNDIISEVKRQLNSLNRQARKAERYRELREELKSIEIVLSSLELSRLGDSLDAASKKLAGVKDEEIRLSAITGEKEAFSEGIKLDYLKEEDEHRAIREKAFELESLIQKEEQAGALSKMRVEEIKRDEERLLREIEELRSYAVSAAEEAGRHNAEISEVDALIRAASQKLDRGEGRLVAATTLLREKEALKGAHAAESLKISARLMDVRHSLQALIKDEEHLRRRESKAASEKEDAAKKLLSMEAPLDSLKEELLRSASEKEAIEAELGGVKGRLDALEKEKASAEAGLIDLKDEFSRASARLAALEEMEKNFDNLRDGARAIMRRKGPEVSGLVADFVEANAGYEKAVEALLGERLQCLIVESQRDGVEAIEYLKRNGAGRGSFAPAKEARVATPLPVEGVADYRGAKELLSEIRIREGYGGVVSSLIGDALVVDNLASALDVWRQNGAYRTIVTLDGEVIDPQGIITGGSTNANDSGILQKRSEIKTLRQRALELEGRISGLDAEIKGVEGAILSARPSLEALRDRLHEADIAKVNLENGLRTRQDDFLRLKDMDAALTAEIGDSSARLAEVARKKAALAAEREALENAAAEKDALAASVQDEISKAAGQKEELAHEVTEIKVSLAQTKERFEALRRQASEKERSIGEASGRIRSREEEISRGKIEAARMLYEIASLASRLEELLKLADEAKKEGVAKAEHLQELNSRLKEIDSELKDIKARLNGLKEIEGELSIEIKETELSAANLKERMNEKYGVDLEAHRPPEGEGDIDIESLESKKNDLREKITALGEVSLSALEEYADLERRHQFLLDQQNDLAKSVESLHAAITRINRTTREKFRSAFEEINAKFQETFPKFFNGGKAELRLSDDGDILESGIEIAAQPPGKRLQNITLLSGGEKALTATSLIFAIFLMKPSPFCLLDEVDAPLDEANIDRFNVFVREMSHISQFILITHNKKTMEMADALYGITMEEPGVSKIISVRF